MVKITIGIPFYNAEKYLSFAIQSVINQTYLNWELYLVNDGSTDGSMEIASTFSEKDNRIKIISDNKNRGLSHRLNQIVDVSNGEYIARMDADDIMTTNRLAEQVAYLDGNEIVDIVGSLAYSINDRNNIIGMKGVNTVPKTISELLKHSFLIHPSIMVRKAWLQKNPYDSSMDRMEDYELWIRTFKHTKFFVLNKPLLFYREINSADKYLKTSKGIRSLLVNLNSNIIISQKDYIVITLMFHLKDIFYKAAKLINTHNMVYQYGISKLNLKTIILAENALKIAIME